MFKGGRDDREQRRRFNRRSLIVGGLQLAAFGVLGRRLYEIQVMESSRYAPLAVENRISLQVVVPPRGRIFDRYGELLATNDEAFRAVLSPSQTSDVRQSLVELSHVVPLRRDRIDELLQKARRTPRGGRFVVISDLTFEQVARLNLLAPQLEGVAVEPVWSRRYLHGASVGHVVGYVGSVERAALDDEPVMRVAGVKVGKSGIEAGLDDALRGQAGTEKIEVNARGRLVRTLERTDAVPGGDITLTIDTVLQQRIVDRLAQDGRAALVALDVNGGEVVAMASVPAFDTTEFAPAITRDSWRRLLAVAHKPMVNRAIAGQYPPASTFKMMTALAGLEAGVITLKEQIACGGRFELSGQVFRCWKRTGHGLCDLERAIRESCDCYFYELARRCGIQAIADMARRFGLGTAQPCGIAMQKSGVVPDPDWKHGRFGKPWLGGETILTGIGQGYVLTTPLQLAVMTARLATGRAATPTLVRPTGPHSARVFSPLDVDPRHIEAIRMAMVSVVNGPGGTGSRAKGNDGELIAGKTGTSQVSSASSSAASGDLDADQRDHALFVGYAPADAPRYAIAAVVEHGGGGGETAAPLFRAALTAILERDPVGSIRQSGGGIEAPRGEAKL